MRVKETTVPVEFIRVMERMERERRFWNTVEAIGFKNSDDHFYFQGTVTYHIKHQTLPISCSLQMIPKTLHICAITDLESGNWIYPKDAMYENGGNHYVAKCGKLLQLIDAEKFITMLISYTRQRVEAILSNLDNRTF